MADEGLVLGQDLPHGRLDPYQVLVAEVRPARQLEVIVEAVLDHRPDGEVRSGPQPQDGLGQHVCGGVAQDRSAGVAVGGEHGHLGTIGQNRGQIDLGTVDGGRHRGLGQPRPDGLGHLEGRRSFGQLFRRAVGKPDRDCACHHAAFLQCDEPRRSQSPPGRPHAGTYRWICRICWVCLWICWICWWELLPGSTE